MIGSEMEQIEYLRILRRRWRVIAAAVVLGVAATFAASPAHPLTPTRTYTATHTLYKDPSMPTETMSLATIGLLTTTGEVPRRVAEVLDYEDEPAILASQVSATTDAELGVLQITMTGTDPDLTAKVANTFASETLRYVEERAAARNAQLREGVDAQLVSQEREIKKIDKQMTSATGVEAEVLRSRRDALIRTYGFTVEQLQSVTSQLPTTRGS